MFVVFCRSQKRGQPLTILPPMAKLRGSIERSFRWYDATWTRIRKTGMSIFLSLHQRTVVPSMQLLDSHQIGSCLEGKFTNLRICNSVWQSKGHTVWKCQISCTNWKKDWEMHMMLPGSTFKQPNNGKRRSMISGLRRGSMLLEIWCICGTVLKKKDRVQNSRHLGKAPLWYLPAVAQYFMRSRGYDKRESCIMIVSRPMTVRWSQRGSDVKGARSCKRARIPLTTLLCKNLYMSPNHLHLRVAVKLNQFLLTRNLRRTRTRRESGSQQLVDAEKNLDLDWCQI